MDRVSIRAYMERWKHLLKGRVLDFGCGTQPYGDLVQGPNSEYLPFDPGMRGTDGELRSFLQQRALLDAVMCNQVFQYIVDPRVTLCEFAGCLKPSGYLVMTYATNWAEVEQEDLHRHTKKGMERLLEHAGFTVVDHTRRCEIQIGEFCVPIGYGIVGRRS
jgi:SAM-dependent methyltransferase